MHSWLKSLLVHPQAPPGVNIAQSPANPSIPSWTPLGAIVATLTATNPSDGSPYLGTLTFGPPHGDDGGVFALRSIGGGVWRLIINPNGPGVGSDGATTQSCTVTA